MPLQGGHDAGDLQIRAPTVDRRVVRLYQNLAELIAQKGEVHVQDAQKSLSALRERLLL